MKSTDTEFRIENFVVPSLLETRGYHIDEVDVPVKIDQNESPEDFPQEIKDAIIENLRKRSWNRYPPPFADSLSEKLGRKLGYDASYVLTAPGSNYLISILLDVFARRKVGKNIILRPSFPLFESHCRYSGIPYETWDLDDNFKFDLKKLENLPKHSLILFASPNNPTGSSISSAELESILQTNPTSLVIADEAYFEFSSTPYHPLVARYRNLVIIRTFSKALGLAGVRIGYILASPDIITQVRKLRLPFLLNMFTLEVFDAALTSKKIADFTEANIARLRSERERLYAELAPVFARKGHRLYPSDANFLLAKLSSDEACESFYKGLIKGGVLVRNISRGLRLQGCLRISIGTAEENDKLRSLVLANLQ
ncbi:MAG: histidinol-phosphate transaminase [Oligoflexales bacterium]